MKIETVSNEENNIYKIKFYSLTDMYDYLNSNPPINRQIFDNPASQSNNAALGEPYNKSLRYLIEGYKENLDNFLQLDCKLQKANILQIDDMRLVKGLYGGIPVASLVASNIKDCMVHYERDNANNVRNVYYNFTYSSKISEDQIFHQGLIALYIIKALEDKNQLVNFKVFGLLKLMNEIIEIEVVLKKPGESFTNVSKCYFPLTRIEFLRRLVFRIIESTPVCNRNWQYGYGSALSLEEIKAYYNLKPQDIVIMNPIDLNITGTDIYQDTINALSALKIDDEFNLSRIRTLSKKNSI